VCGTRLDDYLLGNLGPFLLDDDDKMSLGRGTCLGLLKQAWLTQTASWASKFRRNSWPAVPKIKQERSSVKHSNSAASETGSNPTRTRRSNASTASHPRRERERLHLQNLPVHSRIPHPHNWLPELASTNGSKFPTTRPFRRHHCPDRIRRPGRTGTF
jgi:hypothetical protein